MADIALMTTAILFSSPRALASSVRWLGIQEGTSAVADWIEIDPMAGLQQALFTEADAKGVSASRARGRRLDPDAEIQTSDPTALDRLHATMLLAVPS